MAPLSVVDSQTSSTAPSSSSRSVPSNTGTSSHDAPVSSTAANVAPTPSQSTSQSGEPTLLSYLNENGFVAPIVKHIPKSARHSCTTHLMEVLRDILANPDDAVR